MSATMTDGSGAQFTRRLEAFSDLVFGFSISLLATRLDVPASADEIFSSARWLPVVGTFALICRFWLEHYRVFRHDFVATGFDTVVNFIFLFAIAVFPYSLQTFLKFESMKGPFALYLGDAIVVFLTLSILRVRGLQQRRREAAVEVRLKDWRRSVAQIAISLLLGGVLIVSHDYRGSLSAAAENYGLYLALAVVAITLASRFTLNRLPRFLS